MIIHGQFYDGIVGKPNLDDALEHYGVLGMKWGVRKDPEKAYSKAKAKSEKLSKKIAKANKKYLKKAKLGRLPITVVSKRSVQNARSKVDLLTNKKKKWDETVEKVFADKIQEEKKAKEYEKYLKTENSDLDKKIPKEIKDYINNNSSYDLESKMNEKRRYLKDPDKWISSPNRYKGKGQLPFMYLSDSERSKQIEKISKVKDVDSFGSKDKTYRDFIKKSGNPMPENVKDDELRELMFMEYEEWLKRK